MSRRPGSQAAPGAAAEAYGPQPPATEDVWAARNAVALANEAGCDVDEYERAVLTMLQTAQASREAENRADLRMAAEHPDPEPEPEIDL